MSKRSTKKPSAKTTAKSIKKPKTAKPKKTARKGSTTKKSVKKKTPSKRSSTQTATARKAAVKKAGTKKTSTKKTAKEKTKKKVTPRKASKKKAASIKPTAKKKAARKAATKKKRAAVRKTAAKKAATKRPVKKKAPARRAAAKTGAKKAPTRKRTTQKTIVVTRTGHRPAPQIKPPFEAYKGEKSYIFTSYAHKNMQEVFGVIKKLNESRYRIWYDEGIEPGNEWPEIVGRAVLRCSQFLVFMSPAATKSRNVRNEINLAFSEDKDILVVFLEKTNLTEGMKLQIGTVQFINKYEMKESDFVDKLKKVLSSELRN
jgi:hypothetical protein